MRSIMSVGSNGENQLGRMVEAAFQKSPRPSYWLVKTTAALVVAFSQEASCMSTFPLTLKVKSLLFFPSPYLSKSLL